MERQLALRKLGGRPGRRCRAQRRGDRRARRRGVAAVLAMMFLVIFGSLAAAMAVVAQGNMRTADSTLKVSRAMSAADSGLVFAARRLAQESGRFVVDKGVIDTDFAHDLWFGTYSGGDGNVIVLPPEGYDVDTPPAGIMHAIRDAHLADTHGGSDPELDEDLGTVRVFDIPVGGGEDPPTFSLRYEILAEYPIVRVTCEGVDGDIARVLTMEFRLDKKIEYALLSPNRIMIGKNVMVEGPLGTRYGIVAGELSTEHGDPLVMRSDFYYLNDTLSDKLDTFFQAVVDYDVDGDGRLRPDHPTEGNGVDANPDLVDYDGNEYVDDYDLFLAHYDANGDLMVVYDSDLAAAAGLGSLSNEFADVDDQLARLIDRAHADRDGDGEVTSSDIGLGYNDGVLDVNDDYAKVTGDLAFKVSRAGWEIEHGSSYQTIVQGGIIPDLDDAPVIFEVPDEDLLEITTDMVTEARNWYESQVPIGPDGFNDQVAAGGGSSGTVWEEVPFGAIGAYDYFNRPIYTDMTFSNVRIPMGTNGLFENCIFVGVTYIEAESNNDGLEGDPTDDANWNGAGAYEWDDENGDGVLDDGELSTPRFTDESGNPMTVDLDGTPIEHSRDYSNSIRFHNCTFLGSIAGDPLDEYSHWRNKIQMTGNTRFYLDPDDPELAEQPDATELIALLETINGDDRYEMAKSSLLMPGWSVDVGNFTNEQAPDPDDTASIKLRGTIIAGILDVRGTADVHGTLLMTFRPTAGEGPLSWGGLPDAFNTTVGYFGPADGDNEGMDPNHPDFNGFGEIRLRYDPDATLPDGIPWPVHMRPIPDSYQEGGEL